MAEEALSGRTGAVAVVGGGIGGMQASIDLAESGFKVYLLDNAPAIGGNMARLDKTFPTNDCAMCVMSPKLVECARHLNIDIITNADVKKVTGKPGNFKMEIFKRARFVNKEKCTACGECWNNCPVRNQVFVPEAAEEVHPALSTTETGYEARKSGIHLGSEDKEKVDSILDSYKGEKGILLSVLGDINSRFNYLPKDALRYVSQRLNVPLTDILRVATFYNAFSMAPRGRHLISVCLGTTCFVKGAGQLFEKLERDLEIKDGETTKDLKFTLQKVRCIGCCALAPAIRVDNDVYGRLKLEHLKKVLGLYK